MINNFCDPTGPAEGEGGGGLQPTFLEILKSYREKDVFSLPTLSHWSAPPTFKVAPRALPQDEWLK